MLAMAPMQSQIAVVKFLIANSLFPKNSGNAQQHVKLPVEVICCPFEAKSIRISTHSIIFLFSLGDPGLPRAVWLPDDRGDRDRRAGARPSHAGHQPPDCPNQTLESQCKRTCESSVPAHRPRPCYVRRPRRHMRSFAILTRRPSGPNVIQRLTRHTRAITRIPQATTPMSRAIQQGQSAV